MTETALGTSRATPADESALAPLRRAGFRAAWPALAGSQLTKLARSFHRGSGPPQVRHMPWAPATLER